MSGRTLSGFTADATHHAHLSPCPVDQRQHFKECEQALDWWRGMRPAPWLTPPFAVEGALSCGCELILSGNPEMVEELDAPMREFFEDCGP